MAHRTRIMWIECKDGELAGPARIGRVRFSKTGATLFYDGKTFQSLKGEGFKANYVEVATGAQYWISGCHRDGMDALYSTEVDIDEDVREEYWSVIRRQPEMKAVSHFRAPGKH